MFSAITNASVPLVNRYLPSPFVFSIVLTLIAFAVGLAITGQNMIAMAGHWGNGLWSLHSFAMQMALILVTGYAFASAPFISEFGTNGFDLGLNIVIGLFLFIGLFSHGTLERYYQAVNSGIGGITGIAIIRYRRLGCSSDYGVLFDSTRRVRIGY